MQSVKFSHLHKIARFICFALSLTKSLPSHAETAPSTIYFANSCYERESGDAAGYIVKWTTRPSYPDLWFSWSEGPFEGPVKAQVTQYDRTHERIVFTVPLPDDATHIHRAWHFAGLIRHDTLEGTLMISPDGKREQVLLAHRSESDALNPQKWTGTGYCAPSVSH